LALELRQAKRSLAKIKIGMSAPSGGGKTMSSLLLAYGIVKGEHPEWSDKEIWSKIAIIDSENKSAELYVGKEVNGFRIGIYNTIDLNKEFDPVMYIQAIKMCEDAGMEICIIDSTSHLWREVLDKQGKIAKRTGNSYTAWREVSPQMDDFVNTMLQCNVHIIATMRSKTEYVQEKDEHGKTTVRKVGLAPVQRDGMEYEFTTFLELDAEHMAYGSKDRTGLLDQQYFVVTPKHGMKLAEWLQSADTDGEAIVLGKVERPVDPTEELNEIKGSIKARIDELKGQDVTVESISAVIKDVAEIANYTKITDVNLAKKVLEALNNLN
jgi:hypothetical protein